MTGLSRRQALVGGLTLAAAVGYAPIRVLADPAKPSPPIQERIAAVERRHNARVGLFAVDLDGGRSISHRGQDAFAMCSTFKGYAAARVLQMSSKAS
jgi:beta-lactamase class A